MARPKPESPYEPDRPKGIERLDNICDTEPSVLFALVSVLEEIDRLELFVYGQLRYTGDHRDTICVTQLWDRYRAWSGRDPEPLPEALLIERLGENGWFVDEIEHKVIQAVWREEETATRLNDELNGWTPYEKDKLSKLQARYRHAASTHQWNTASDIWIEIQALRAKKKAARRS